MFSESPVDQWTDLILGLDMPDYLTTFSGMRKRKSVRERERETERQKKRQRIKDRLREIHRYRER